MAFTQWAAGAKISAARLAGITPKFKDWVPTWSTSTGTNLPSYGNAQINCRYAQSGDLVVATFFIRFGNTTNFGGGTATTNYRFGLPVPAANVGDPVGWLSIFPGTDNAVPVIPKAATSTEFELGIVGGWLLNSSQPANGLADAVTPKAWTANMEIWGTLQYEGA